MQVKEMGGDGAATENPGIQRVSKCTQIKQIKKMGGDGVATVFFPRGLTRHTGGRDRVVIEADSFRELVAVLEARFPGLRQSLEEEMAVAIDGEIIQEPLLERIHPASEIHFLPRISGGC